MSIPKELNSKNRVVGVKPSEFSSETDVVRNGVCQTCGAFGIPEKASDPRAVQWTPEEIAAFRAEDRPPTELPRIREKTHDDRGTPVRASTAEVVLPNTAESTATPVQPAEQ